MPSGDLSPEQLAKLDEMQARMGISRQQQRQQQPVGPASGRSSKAPGSRGRPAVVLQPANGRCRYSL